MPGFFLGPDHVAANPNSADHITQPHHPAADISVLAVHLDALVFCHEIVRGGELSLTA